jgi:tRNA (mo5U34)-methyltransferase
MDASADLLKKIHSLKWIHTIDLGGGVVTPGLWPRSALIDAALNQIDFCGKKVLDIGCWDGLWTFEAERRGAAEVYATDCLSQRPLQDQPTFELAHRIRNSQAKYFPHLPVCEVQQLGVRDFDIVLFCGIYYHLKDPLLAMARLRQVMREGGILIVEGVAIRNERDCYARFFYHDRHGGDASNWWAPTIACLREWIECSCFEVVGQHFEPSLPPANSKFKGFVRRLLCWSATETMCRAVLTARAVTREDGNYLYPDPELSGFLTVPEPALAGKAAGAGVTDE